MKYLTTLVAIAGFATLAGAPARADAGLEARSETVKFADLNPGTPGGSAVLFRRLQAAALRVCRDLDSRELAMLEPHTACVRTAMRTAIVHIDEPALTAYAADHGTFEAAAGIRIARTR